MTGTPFSAHHVAISVRDPARSVAFYRVLGFEPGLEWTSPEGDLTILYLLHPSGPGLELLAYTDNRDRAPVDRGRGDDLRELGVRQLALRVDDLARARAELHAAGHQLSEIKKGRTLIDYFYVRDPDGLWVEIVEDRRDLDPARPVRLGGGPGQ